jgi:hypothetical protein
VKILVAIPYRHDTLPIFTSKAAELAMQLNGRHDYDIQLWPNEAPPGKAKYGPNAWARNQMIDGYLSDHDFVFWPDVDIVDYPADIIDRVGLDSNRIAAPVTYIESLIEGGWFYDTGGFTKNGRTTNAQRGIANPGSLSHVPMDSVGCNAIVPSWLYQEGLRYTAVNDEVEHVAFCKSAMARFDVGSYAAVNVRCYHAYYPHYGLEWH